MPRSWCAKWSGRGWRVGPKRGTSMPGAANERQGKMDWRSVNSKNRKITQPTNLGYHTKIKSFLIMRLNCGNALKSPEGPHLQVRGA